MKTYILPSILIIVLSMFTGSVQAQSPWEEAAIEGIKCMNRGNGEKFTKISHPDFMIIMRDFFIGLCKASPNSTSNKKIFKDFGVSNITELEALPLKQFVSAMVKYMHFTLPPDFQKTMREMKVEILHSVLKDDTYQIKSEMIFNVKGSIKKSPAIFLVKKDGGTWKYNGDVESVRRFKKNL